MWFSQSVAGTVARITADGTITEGPSRQGHEPFGITAAPEQRSRYTGLSANKIPVLQLR
jgi:hypothetical protein